MMYLIVTQIHFLSYEIKRKRRSIPVDRDSPSSPGSSGGRHTTTPTRSCRNSYNRSSDLAPLLDTYSSPDTRCTFTCNRVLSLLAHWSCALKAGSRQLRVTANQPLGEADLLHFAQSTNNRRLSVWSTLFGPAC